MRQSTRCSGLARAALLFRNVTPAVLADLCEIRLERVAGVTGAVAVDKNQDRACKEQDEENDGAGGGHSVGRLAAQMRRLIDFPSMTRRILIFCKQGQMHACE